MDPFPFREPVSTWTHGAALIAAFPGVALLLSRAGPERGKRLSVLVYGFGLVFCYAASALFHGVRVPPDRLGPFARLDSLGILALIAGSYTPLAWNLMGGRWRAGTLGAVWGAALGAGVWIASGRPFTPALATGVYLVMGWGILICYARVARTVSHRALFPLVLGGVLYSVGALLNVLRWPTLWPETFGSHELFHLFVIAGSLTHYLWILRVVIPFGRGPRGAGATAC